jgi:hypothetical protein
MMTVQAQRAYGVGENSRNGQAPLAYKCKISAATVYELCNNGASAKGL